MNPKVPLAHVSRPISAAAAFEQFISDCRDATDATDWKLWRIMWEEEPQAKWFAILYQGPSGDEPDRFCILSSSKPELLAKRLAALAEAA